MLVSLNQSSCVQFPLSTRLIECDNDLRLQLLPNNQAFDVLQMLLDFTALNSKLVSDYSELQQILNKTFEISDSDINGLKLQQFVARGHVLVGSVVLALKLYASMIHPHLSADLDLLPSIGALTIAKRINNSYYFVSSRENFDNLTANTWDQYQNVMASNLKELSSTVSQVSPTWLHMEFTMAFFTYSVQLSVIGSLLMEMKQVRNSLYTCIYRKCPIYLGSVDPAIDVLFYDAADISKKGTCYTKYLKRLLDMISLAGSTIDFNLSSDWSQCIYRSALASNALFISDFNNIVDTTAASEVLAILTAGVSGQLYSPSISVLNANSVLLSAVAPNSVIVYTTSLNLQVTSKSLKTTKSRTIGRKLHAVCPPGFCGKTCAPCPPGQWSSGDGTIHLCSNIPDNATPTGTEGKDPNCPFICNDPYQYASSNTACSTAPVGTYPIDGLKSLGTCVYSNNDAVNQFITFTGPGSRGLETPCPAELQYILKYIYPLSTALRGNFSMQVWVLFNATSAGITVDSLDATGGVGFDIITIPGIFSLGVIVTRSGGNLVGTLECRNWVNGGVTRAKDTFSVDGNWHHFAVIYDAKLLLLALYRDGAIVATSWFQWPIATDPGIFLVGGYYRNLTLPPQPPSFYRLAPIYITGIEIYNATIPVELLTYPMPRIPRTPSETTEWNGFQMVPKCTDGSHRDGSNGCVCMWGKYLNQGQCVWCPDGAAGSNYPRTSVSDCICLSTHYFDPVQTTCLVAKPAMPYPVVSYTPTATTLDASGTMYVPAGTIMTFSMPKTYTPAVGDFPVTLSVTIWQDFTTLASNKTSVDVNNPNWSWSYTFTTNGDYKVQATLDKLGTIRGNHYAAAIAVRYKYPPPSYLPLSPYLSDVSVVHISATGAGQYRILYSLDGTVPSVAYDFTQPPRVWPPAQLRAKIVTIDDPTKYLDSDEISQLYKWNTSSVAYYYFKTGVSGYTSSVSSSKMSNGTVNGTSTSSSTSTLTVASTSTFEWCTSNIPLCAIVFAVPPVGVFVLTILLIVICVCCKKKRARKSKSGKSKTKKSKSKDKKPLIKKSEPAKKAPEPPKFKIAKHNKKSSNIELPDVAPPKVFKIKKPEPGTNSKPSSSRSVTFAEPAPVPKSKPRPLPKVKEAPKPRKSKARFISCDRECTKQKGGIRNIASFYCWNEKVYLCTKCCINEQHNVGTSCKLTRIMVCDLCFKGYEGVLMRVKIDGEDAYFCPDCIAEQRIKVKNPDSQRYVACGMCKHEAVLRTEKQKHVCRRCSLSIAKIVLYNKFLVV